MAIETGRWGRLGSLALPGLLTLATLLHAGCRPSRDGVDPATLPPEVRGDYDVFARRCSKCHSLARPLTSGITDQGQWESYVNRMRMQPGSGITASDQVVILRFLKYNSAEELRKKAAKNGVSTAPPPPEPQAPPPKPPAPPVPAAPAPAPAAPAPAPAVSGSAP